MNTQENYQKKVEQFVIIVSNKYVNRKNIFEPLSKILPEYWKDIFLSAVKKVMFKRVYVIPATKIESKLVWVIKDPSRGTNKIAQEIIKYERVLRKLVWNKNDWGDPYYYERPKNYSQGRPAILDVKAFEYKKVTPDGTPYIVGLMEFKRKYSEAFKLYGIDDNLADALLEAIYKTIHDSFDTGFDMGVKTTKYTRKVFNSDQIVDVYNNIELTLADLKKIIDES